MGEKHDVEAISSKTAQELGFVERLHQFDHNQTLQTLRDSNNISESGSQDSVGLSTGALHVSD